MWENYINALYVLRYLTCYHLLVVGNSTVKVIPWERTSEVDWNFNTENTAELYEPDSPVVRQMKWKFEETLNSLVK